LTLVMLLYQGIVRIAVEHLGGHLLLLSLKQQLKLPNIQAQCIPIYELERGPAHDVSARCFAEPKLLPGQSCL
jgi:hypothetical protein